MVAFIPYTLVLSDSTAAQASILLVSRKAIAAVKMNINSLAQKYPDPECTELKKSLARYLGIDPEWITMGNGAIEVIYWFVKGNLCKKAGSNPSTDFL